LLKELGLGKKIKFGPTYFNFNESLEKKLNFNYLSL